MSNRKARIVGYFLLATTFAVGSLYEKGIITSLIFFGTVFIFCLGGELILIIYYKNNIPPDHQVPLSYMKKFYKTFEYSCSYCSQLNLVYVNMYDIKNEYICKCENCSKDEEISLKTLLKNFEAKEKNEKRKFYKLEEADQFCEKCNSIITLDTSELLQNQFICPECKSKNIIKDIR